MSAGDLIIYHTSDIHSHLGFGAKLKQISADKSLLVDCGDCLAGSSTWYRAREPVIADLQLAGYQMQAVGNREFHYVYALLLARARRLPANLVCSNVIDLWKRPPAFTREMYFDVRGLRVRVLALLVPQYRTGSGWEKIFGWRFLAPEAALEEMLALQKQPSDATLLLSHLGLDADLLVAQQFPSLSAIFGGHSHDKLMQPSLVNGVPIAHPGAFAQYVGRMQLHCENGKTSLSSYELLPLLAA